MPIAHPSSASRRAMAAPMPLAPPVTRTALPFSPRTASPALAGQHARGLVADHDLAGLILDVDFGGNNTAVAFRGGPHRRDLDLGMDGVADAHRRQHLLLQLEHGKSGALDHALAEQA